MHGFPELPNRPLRSGMRETRAAGQSGGSRPPLPLDRPAAICRWSPSPRFCNRVHHSYRFFCLALPPWRLTAWPVFRNRPFVGQHVIEALEAEAVILAHGPQIHRNHPKLPPTPPP